MNVKEHLTTHSMALKDLPKAPPKKRKKKVSGLFQFTKKTLSLHPKAGPLTSGFVF